MGWPPHHNIHLQDSHDIALYIVNPPSLNPLSHFPIVHSFESLHQHAPLPHPAIHSKPQFLHPEDIADHHLALAKSFSRLNQQLYHRTRALTSPTPTIRIHDEMMLAQAPGSPPELTSSKSSKSSSFHTSSAPNADGIETDLSHFEEIGLEDDATNVTNFKKNKDIGNGSAISSQTNKLSTKPQTVAVPVMRELVNGVPRSATVPLTGYGDSISRQGSPLSLALPGAKKSMPNLGLHSKSPSRSPSPTHLNQRPISPRRIPSNSSLRAASSPNISRPFPRRESVNKPRKTSKEIEEEYHDSDEDLPDDASLWNVPLSPGLYRTASSAANSTNASANTSPERPSFLSSSPGLSHLRSSKSAPMPAKPFSPAVESVPASPISPRLPRGASAGAVDTFTFGKARAKSWNNVLSDLSEDAIMLSEALDAHSQEADQRRGSSEVNVKESSLDKRRVKSSIVELPPLRRNNVMIDPLPISKEKEKVLSRTRPSWLPPKSQKEEKKHLKEYQKMMEASLEAEKRRAAKAVTEKCARDDTTLMLQRIWDEHVLPHWSSAIREPRSRELWWRGVPVRARPEVWKRAITNELGLTPNTYAKALARARAVEVSSPASTGSAQEVPKEVSWLNAIRRDVRHTLTGLHLFQTTQPLHEGLIDLLSAYAFYRSDVGYVYGIHLPAALLLLTMPSASDAFTALANILNRPLPLAFLTGDPSGTNRTYDLVLSLLKAKRPRLFQHLFGSVADGGLAMTPEELLEPMIRTLFLSGCCDEPASPAPPTAASIKSPFSSFSFSAPTSPKSPKTPKSSQRGLSLPLVQRLWDVIAFDGDAAIIRACVGILAAKESALYGKSEDVLAILGWKGSLKLGEEVSFGTPGEITGLNKGEEAVEAVMALIRSVGKEDGKKEEERE